MLGHVQSSTIRSAETMPSSKSFLACFLIVGVCFFQASALRLRRDDAAADKSPSLDDLSKKATDFLGDLSSQFSSAVNAKDSEELRSILKSNTDSFINSITDLTKSFQDQISRDASDPDHVLGKVIAKFNETIAGLKEQNPETVEKVKDLQDKLEAGLKSVASETDKIVKSLDENTKDMQEDIAKLSKKAYAQVVETAKDLKDQLHEAANKDTKKE